MIAIAMQELQSDPNLVISDRCRRPSTQHMPTRSGRSGMRTQSALSFSDGSSATKQSSVIFFNPDLKRTHILREPQYARLEGFEDNGLEHIVGIHAGRASSAGSGGDLPGHPRIPKLRAIRTSHETCIVGSFFVMGAMIAAFGAGDAAIAAPEQIGCYGDNWGSTLEMLEPTPVGPLTFNTLRCMPIPEGWPRFLPPSLSPNGGLVFAFGSTKGLWLGDVARRPRPYRK
ncbi:hypothetical protein ACOJBO_46345 [Rhizobium beringeri]